ncbi:MAG TPA: hypothetical protein PLL64_10295 [Rhodothermales bacterium]|nr:hypothetical protein [Rhodothermales bacterium]HRR07240.1 hypothetical protein [Rhodothermales bacterium]
MEHLQHPNKSLFTWLLAAFCVAWLPFLVFALGGRIEALYTQHRVAWARYEVILLGMGLYAVVEILVWRNPSGRLGHSIAFLKVFTHELLHMVVSMLFLNRMIAFNAARDEGHVQYAGSGNALIALAPYFLPFYTLLLLLVRIGFSVEAYPLFDVFLGMTYAFHLVTFWQQQSPLQPDLQQIGLIPAYLLIFTFNLFFLGMMLIVPSRGWIFFWKWLIYAS